MRPKKFLDDAGAFLRQDSGANLRPVIQPRMAEQVAHRSSHTRFLIPCTEDDALDARKNDCSRAHRARLDGHVESAVVETPAIQLGRSFANGEHFRVRGGILIAESAIACRSDDRTFAHDHGANRHFIAPAGFAGDVERVTNVLLVTSN